MAEHFKIVSQTPRSEVQPGGAIVPVIDVTYTALPSNQSGKVTIPQHAYSAAEVARVVGRAAQVLNDVQAL